MKKIIKNILLTFVIIYTILNLALYVTNMILKYSLICEQVLPFLSEERDIQKSIEIEEEIKKIIEGRKEIYGENAPVTALFVYENYFTGINYILYSQSTILITTVVLSIAIGTILSLTEKSKTKELLKFITVGILCILLYMTIMYITGEYKGFNIFEAIIETINSVGIYYIVAYLVKIVYIYYKNKKSVKELNKELEIKNK